MTRSAPAFARARAKFWPRPRLAPVTMATRPVRSKRSLIMAVRSSKCGHGAISWEFIHEAVPGVRTTFIKFGSREYKRSNHCGPSSRGATAEMSGLTLIAPLVSRSIALGYYPADAHEHGRR